MALDIFPPLVKGEIHIMKAAVVVANEDVQYQEIEEPKVTKGTVKIKVRYSSCSEQRSTFLPNRSGT